MNILVLGGTRFFGKVLVNKLIDQGDNVTIATRGITKDSYGDKVNRIILDRENKESIENELKDKRFDVVYDNICYSPNSIESLCNIIKDKTKKYIVVSSSAVYDDGKCLKEEEFNPYKYKIQYGERKDFSYAEGKRLLESVVFQKHNIPTVAVRFPVVLGEEDYTKRLYSYVENIVKENTINIDNLNNELSFITAKEAGEFLEHLNNTNYEGTINAASEGHITIKEIIKYIENKTSKTANIKEKGENAAYNGMYDCSLNIEKAKKLGFKCEEIRSYIFNLLDKYIIEVNK